MTRARGEVDQELEVISKYEQEPEFRDFVKNLLRCRSLASLDDNKEQSDERKDDLKVLDVKKRNDDIEVVDVKRRHQHVMRERRQGDERCGRGEDGGAARVSWVCLLMFLVATATQELAGNLFRNCWTFWPCLEYLNSLNIITRTNRLINIT